MIDILRDIHKWVPSRNQEGCEEVFDRVPMVGDQKTIKRGVEAQFSVSNAYSKERRLEGLYFQIADWHHENKFLAVCKQFVSNFQVFAGMLMCSIYSFVKHMHVGQYKKKLKIFFNFNRSSAMCPIMHIFNGLMPYDFTHHWESLIGYIRLKLMAWY